MKANKSNLATIAWTLILIGLLLGVPSDVVFGSPHSSRKIESWAPSYPLPRFNRTGIPLSKSHFVSTEATNPVCLERLVNGDFETGDLSPWEVSGAAKLDVGRESDNGVRMVGENLASGELSQRVTIPEGASAVSLHFWWLAQPALVQAGDVLEVQVKRDQGQVDLVSSFPAVVPSGQWQQETLTLTSYSGLDVTLNFSAHTDGDEASAFWLDDISLQACYGLYMPLMYDSLEISPSEFEEVPAWNNPDLAVTRLDVDPERADPGEQVNLIAEVTNVGTGDASEAELVFYMDDEEIDRRDVSPLIPWESVAVEAAVNAEGPGRHEIRVELAVNSDVYDRTDHNDALTRGVWISGEADPQPALEFGDIDVNTLDLEIGQPADIPLWVRNPSFAEISYIPIRLFIDSETVAEDAIEGLGPGMEQELHIPWAKVTPGGHMVRIEMDLPDGFPLRDLEDVKVWNLHVPSPTFLYDKMETGKWVSIGPRSLTDGVGGLTTGSVGRMDAIAFHPKNSSIMYAGAPKYYNYPSGGVWKTTNGGDSWTPLMDKLPPEGTSCIAVDPKNGDIVYAGTGSGMYSGGVGIYKSVDGGKNWSLFAKAATTRSGNPLNITGVSALEVRYTNSGQVLIYAATDVGVLRYKGSDPLALKSSGSDWVRIRSGRITDLNVHPTDYKQVYASVVKEGIIGTTVGDTATELNWDLIGGPVTISTTTGQWYTFDVYWGTPKTVYAALRNPEPGKTLIIARTTSEGKVWTTHKFSAPEMDTAYNPFFRVSPLNKDLFYFGGVKLYKNLWIGGTFLVMFQIENIHDDMHGMEWDPWEPSKYYILGDGGIWHCTVSTSSSDTCLHRNTDLRVTTFYDFDISATNTNLMIGGTQDCGTIMYQGKPDWKFIKGGDGLFSLIAPGNQLFYAQHQFLDDTARCDKGVNCWVNDWSSADKGLPSDDKWGGQRAQIAVNPNDHKNLISVGDQVYWTHNGGQSWNKIGPSVYYYKGFVTRVAFQPKTFRPVVGTSKGQIWIFHCRTGGCSWKLIFEHGDGAEVKSLAFSTKDNRQFYATFWGGNSARRVASFYFQPGDPPTVMPFFLAKTFPANRSALAIAGDPHNVNGAFVATERGVYYGTGIRENWTWQEYNDGLPLVEIKDILVDPTSKELRAASWGRGAWSIITGP